MCGAVQKFVLVQNYIFRPLVFRFGQSLKLSNVLLKGNHVLVHKPIISGAFNVRLRHHTRHWVQQHSTVRISFEKDDEKTMSLIASAVPVSLK